MTNSAGRYLGCIAVVVRDYDEAIDWYARSLGFVLIEDKPLSEAKRWVLIAPSPSSQTRILLARAVGPDQMAAVGRQSGGRVFLFLHTDDFARDYGAFRGRGVHFMEAPRDEPYGRVAVFEDLYGNRWDLLEPRG